MFLRKIEGPRSVTLPDGSILTRADLPPEDTVRWVASRKATVVRAVRHGLMTSVEAMERYNLSEEELASWMKAIKEHGVSGLKATALRSLSEST